MQGSQVNENIANGIRGTEMSVVRLSSETVLLRLCFKNGWVNVLLRVCTAEMRQGLLPRPWLEELHPRKTPGIMCEADKAVHLIWNTCVLNRLTVKEVDWRRACDGPHQPPDSRESVRAGWSALDSGHRDTLR